MRILLYGINYFPELTGIGKYSGEMAEWLVARGHQVRVVTVPPYYPAWKISKGYSGVRYQREKRQGVEIWRCPVWVPEKPSGVKRLLHLASYALSSLPVMLMQVRWKPDVVMVIEPPLMLSPNALVVAGLSGAKSWMHVQDLEVDAAFQLGLLPDRPWLMRMVEGVESRIMRRFDRVTSISSQMVQRLIAKHVEWTRTGLFPNWVDTDQIFPLDRPSLFRKELDLAEYQTVVLYSGNMGEKQGLEVLIEAADQLREEPTIRFVLCGDGAAKNRLQTEAERRNLPNLIFLPLQPVEKLNDLLNLADIHALVQKEQASDLVMPSKLTGMLASGRPVIATAMTKTAVAEAVLLADAGRLVPPDNSNELVKAIRELAADKNKCLRFGQNARRYAETQLGKESILCAMEKLLDDF